jgi:hypothetical protein
MSDNIFQKSPLWIYAISLLLVVTTLYFVFDANYASALTCNWDGDQTSKVVSNSANWENTNCPGKDVNDNTYLFASSSDSVIWDFSGSPSTIGDLQLNTGFTGTLHASTSNTTSTFTIGGDFAVNVGAFDPGTTTVAFATSTHATSTIILGGSNFFGVSFNDNAVALEAEWILRDQFNASSTITITGGIVNPYGNNVFLDGNWANSDTYTAGTSTVSFTTSTAATQTILSGGSPFFEIILNDSGGSATARLLDQLNSSSTVTITGGTLSPFGNSIFIDDNWTNSDIFTAGTSTVTFSTSTAATSTVTLGGSPFYNLIINDSGGGAAVETKDQLNASSSISILGGELQTNGFNVFLDGDWTNNDTYHQGTSTVTFTGTNQTINGTTTFNNLTKTVTSTAITLTFENGNTQTVVGTTTIHTPVGNIVSLRSAVAGNIWTIDQQGSTLVVRLDVKDSTNSNATVISCSKCINSGNNTNWTFSPVAGSNGTDTSSSATIIGGGGIYATPIVLITPGLPQSSPLHQSGTLVKIVGNSAVYLIEGNNRRAFPHANIFFSRYDNFNKVLTILPDELSTYALKSNVTYTPGTLIKIQSDPKVYEVMDDEGTIVWVPSEEVAEEKFGNNWAQLIFDVPVSFWTNYTIIEPFQGV